VCRNILPVLTSNVEIHAFRGRDGRVAFRMCWSLFSDPSQPRTATFRSSATELAPGLAELSAHLGALVPSKDEGGA